MAVVRISKVVATTTLTDCTTPKVDVIKGIFEKFQYLFIATFCCLLNKNMEGVFLCFSHLMAVIINLLTPNDPYMGRTAPLTPKRWILYIYSTNTGTEYFKHALYSPFFLLKMQCVS